MNSERCQRFPLAPIGASSEGKHLPMPQPNCRILANAVAVTGGRARQT